MRLGDDDENEGNARETVPGLHAQQVQELRESKYRRLRTHTTFVTENWSSSFPPLVAMVKATHSR